MMIPAPASHAKSLVRILQIEDNAASRQLMSDYLRHHGWDVMSLEEGTSFAAAMTQFQPHLVLLDLKLPDVDGYTLLQQMQENPDWRLTPVIVISAFAFQADKQRALDLGARRYLVKPVNLAQLRQAICEELGSLSG
jgi:two-component system, cell cycle response regulator DivK